MKLRKVVTCCYVLMQFLLYILMFTLSSYFKYIAYFSIIINFIYALTFIKQYKDKKVIMLQIGLFLTLVADFFLVLIGKYKDIAMISFCLCQFVYAFILLENSNHKKRDLYIRSGGSIGVVLLTMIILKDNIDFLSIISMVYYFNLLMNVIVSYINPQSILFSIGLTLFILCDTVIGLENLILYTDVFNDSFIYKIINVDFNLAWAFYLPSQVLIVLCINKKQENMN